MLPAENCQALPSTSKGRAKVSVIETHKRPLSWNDPHPQYCRSTFLRFSPDLDGVFASA